MKIYARKEPCEGTVVGDEDILPEIDGARTDEDGEPLSGDWYVWGEGSLHAMASWAARDAVLESAHNDYTRRLARAVFRHLGRGGPGQ